MTQVGGRVYYESDAAAVRRDPRASVRAGDPRPAQPPTSAPRLTRRRRSADPMYIDPRIIPPGMSYEWKVQSIFGAPRAGHWNNLRENHWKPVPAERHPELATDGESIISRAGTVLCERPSYLTDEAKMEDIQDAMLPMEKTDELLYGTPPGHLTRDTPSTRQRNYINRQWAPGDPREQPGIDDGTLYSEP